MSKLTNKPPVDIDMLTMALQGGELNTGWWLDTETGEVIPEPDPDGNTLEKKLIKSRQSQPARYIDIEPMPASIIVELMESFIVTLDDHTFCEKLSAALTAKQPVWHFKNTLAADPSHEDSWYAFKEQFFALQARQWARQMGLSFETREMGEIQQGSFAAKLSADQTQSHELLNLTVPEDKGYRRYVLWRTETGAGEMTLTASQGGERATDQVIGEATIDGPQVQNINHVLGQVKLSIGIGESSRQPCSVLQINEGHRQSEVSGPAEPGSALDQLQTLFDFLLGLSRNQI